MSNSDERRWQQRLDNFGAALAQLMNGCERERYYDNKNDCETLLDTLDKRNLLSHTYWREVAREAEALIKERYYPVPVRLYATLDAKRTP